MAICAVPPWPTVWTLWRLVLAGRVPDRVSLPSSPTSPSCPGTEGGRCRASGGTLSGRALPCCGHSPAPCSNTESPSDGSNLTWLPPVLSPLLWLWSSDIPCRDIGESPWLWLVVWLYDAKHDMTCHAMTYRSSIFSIQTFTWRGTWGRCWPSSSRRGHQEWEPRTGPGWDDVRAPAGTRSPCTDWGRPPGPALVTGLCSRESSWTRRCTEIRRWPLDWEQEKASHLKLSRQHLVSAGDLKRCH